ncbi:hypothetical protein CK203_035466 [Vitis vinifera]|uniref:Uncharacterized protein n=1 Tax=Vitis vinifera TaxID=29760 RepID=A0A438I3N5_VITVI|nr:hypothetical protein CK203_035466 [Vitis vinifera]
MISHQKSHSAGISQLRKWFWHTSATSQHSDINFAAAKLTAKLLRKWQVAAKLAFSPSSPSPSHAVCLRSSSPFSNAGQRSISQNGTNTRGKVFIPFESQKSCERSHLQTCSKAFAVETKSSPVKPAPPKPPASDI